jgi:predicted nucleic acid-binding Zn ribbon protein
MPKINPYKVCLICGKPGAGYCDEHKYLQVMNKLNQSERGK